MNSTIENQHGYNTKIANFNESEIGTAIDGGMPSESLLNFSGETAPTKLIQDETKTKLAEAIDCGAPAPEFERLIQEANLLDTINIEQVSYSLKQDSIAITIESIDAGEGPNFSF